MDSKLFRKKLHPLISSHDQEENDIGQESGPESPSSTVKMASLSSPKRSKRGIQKRVVSVPIKDVEGSRLKGENAPPPSDSWAWRKYGQKPIKGSPYPRGYYRCSSSKGCPARKQVERSRMDPTMLVVTYSCEHNHPWPPPSRIHGGHHHHHHNSNNHHNDSTQNDDVASPKPEVTAKDENICTPPQAEPEERFADLRDESLADEFGWFGGMEGATTTTTRSSSIFHSHIMAGEEEEKRALFFPMREEDELLYADLGELPECSAVFRYCREVGPEVQIC